MLSLLSTWRLCSRHAKRKQEFSNVIGWDQFAKNFLRTSKNRSYFFLFVRTNSPSEKLALVGLTDYLTWKVKVLSLPETIKQNSTFRAKALRRELAVGNLYLSRIIEYTTYTGNVSSRYYHRLFVWPRALFLLTLGLFQIAFQIASVFLVQNYGMSFCY